MKRAFLLFLTIIIFQSFAFAQTQSNKTSACPEISIEMSPAFARAWENVTFKVKFEKDFNTSRLKFIWKVSSAKILKGQKTKSILIPPSLLASTYPTATVEILGLPKDCVSVFRESMPHVSYPLARSIGEDSQINGEEENEKLNLLAAEMQDDPHATAFITKSYLRNTNKASIYQDLQRILNYLESLGSDKTRIMFGISYNKEELTKVFLVPRGAEQPEFNGEILDAAKLAEKLKNIKPAAKKKSAGKN